MESPWYLGQVDGVAVFCVSEQMNVELSRDLVLRRSPCHQDSVWGELQLLDGVQANALDETSLHLVNITYRYDLSKYKYQTCRVLF